MVEFSFRSKSVKCELKIFIEMKILLNLNDLVSKTRQLCEIVEMHLNGQNSLDNMHTFWDYDKYMLEMCGIY